MNPPSRKEARTCLFETEKPALKAAFDDFQDKIKILSELVERGNECLVLFGHSFLLESIRALANNLLCINTLTFGLPPAFFREDALKKNKADSIHAYLIYKALKEKPLPTNEAEYLEVKGRLENLIQKVNNKLQNIQPLVDIQPLDMQPLDEKGC